MKKADLLPHMPERPCVPLSFDRDRVGFIMLLDRLQKSGESVALGVRHFMVEGCLPASRCPWEIHDARPLFWLSGSVRFFVDHAIYLTDSDDTDVGYRIAFADVSFIQVLH